MAMTQQQMQASQVVKEAKVVKSLATPSLTGEAAKMPAKMPKKKMPKPMKRK